MCKYLSIFIWAKNAFNHVKIKKKKNKTTKQLYKNYDKTIIEMSWLFKKKNPDMSMCIVRSWQPRKLHFLSGLLKFFWVTLENSKNLFPRASDIQSLWNSSCLHLLPLQYGRAAVISVCNICYCSPNSSFFMGNCLIIK